MVDFRVRPYSEDDETSVVDLWSQVFPDAPARNEPRSVIHRKLKFQRDLFLVGESGGEIVGTVIAGFDGFRGWVYHLAVHPQYRRLGFGRELMREAEAKLEAIGCPKINLQVRSSNEEVIAFYRRLGYSLEERASLGKPLE